MSQAGKLEEGTALPSIETLTGDIGAAVGPDGSYNIDILGGNNVTITGDPGTYTVSVAVTGTTDHAPQIGNATGSLTSLGPLTDGQLIIGSTGVDPVAASLTSTDGSVTITPGAGTIDLAAAGGGLEINIATLTGNITLTAGTDKTVQMLNPDGVVREITLAKTGVADGSEFYILNDSVYTNYFYLNIKEEGGNLYDMIAGTCMKHYIYSSVKSAWFDVVTGGDIGVSPTLQNTIIGQNSHGKSTVICGHNNDSNNGSGVIVGWSCTASSTDATIVGSQSEAANYATAIGRQTKATGGNSVAIGALTDTNSMKYAIAKGNFSKCTRVGEEWNTVGNASNHYGYGQVDWHIQTTNNTPAEIFLAAYSTSRFTIAANSSVAFNMIAVARNNADAVSKSWLIQGTIQRDGSNNTALVGAITSTVINESGVYDTTFDTGNWTCVPTADDANEALIITVTGEAKTIRWNVTMQYSEVRF